MYSQSSIYQLTDILKAQLQSANCNLLERGGIAHLGCVYGFDEAERLSLSGPGFDWLLQPPLKK
jgi:hypothetical protein